MGLTQPAQTIVGRLEVGGGVLGRRVQSRGPLNLLGEREHVGEVDGVGVVHFKVAEVGVNLVVRDVVDPELDRLVDDPGLVGGSLLLGDLVVVFVGVAFAGEPRSGK